MPIKRLDAVSITCDGCGTGYDEIGTSPQREMEYLKAWGWTGTYRKCYCLECSKKMDGGNRNDA